MIELDLTVVWAFVIAFAVFAYVVMDGFDLGIGILFPLFPGGRERDSAINSVAPVWDGNETWLVLGGGGLMAAFPLAYAIILPALYAPLIAMLLGLILRGVAFEFRWRDPAHRPWWDFSFTLGSIVATLAQGITLGALLQGITVEGRSYAGGWWDWLTPFSVLVGVSLVIGYALLGATWLIMKSEDRLQEHCYRLARILGPLLVACIVLVSLFTPFLSEAYYRNWFSFPRVLFAAQVPLLVAIGAVVFFVALARRWEYWPFLSTLALFALGLIGLGVSMFPYVIPGAVTIWDAASPAKSQLFMLVGASVLIPIILIYTGYSYWVFRGKTGHEGYH
ncbi:MAG TPA: cytochrome d ubiquinol oxidase subunit II [Geminicoccus sp.]|uniref:cytochrome d ubiquinol oxidase subunit II n=1 Tax=Geminicoccus sp. TaxID=2024832 RepID=UPI002C91BBD4|nr:cytochrome d ubiquinol oxidase subunit II [Geminicoccus sp.]HWL70478.1 cytochrome d ubiquinol oxidase subunit II [Geminicoccus sp.]